MGHAVSGRGEDIRHWQFADLFLFDYSEHRHVVGPCEFVPLYIARNEGKTLAATSRTEYQAMVRHRDPLKCPIGSLAMHLYTQQHMGRRRSPPDVLAGRAVW